MKKNNDIKKYLPRALAVGLSFTMICSAAGVTAVSSNSEKSKAEAAQSAAADTKAAETKAAMEQLELAYLDASSNYKINQLLLIPCVILDFLCIHPFSDGNGRISRLLSLLLLYKNGFDVGKYISYEEQINKYKDLYYDALQRSSAGWETNENDYFPFIQNFLSMLYMCYKELDKRFAVVSGKKINKTARIEATVLNSLTSLSKAEICAIHPDISPSTVEAVLGKMLKEGKIKKTGASKNTKYIRAI